MKAGASERSCPRPRVRARNAQVLVAQISEEGALLS